MRLAANRDRLPDDRRLPPNRRCQSAWLITTARGAFGTSSLAWNERPMCRASAEDVEVLVRHLLAEETVRDRRPPVSVAFHP